MHGEKREPAVTDGGAEGSTPRAKAVSILDLAMVAGLPFMCAVSWLVPERLWPGLCRAAAPIAVPALAGDLKALARTIGETQGSRQMCASADDILRGLAAVEIRSILQLLRHYRPDGWTPEVRVAGLEHIAAALEKGRGAILWVGVCMDSGNILSKLAFHRAGFGYTQLTSAGHPFSSSRFGMRFLNPIHTAIEDRYLVAQVMLSPNDADAALKELRARLADNGIVAFTAHRKAKRPVCVPFLDGEIVLGPGAPIMALRTRAPLLPVFTFQGGSGAPTVTVGPPLDVRHDIPKNDAVEGAVRQYAAALEPMVIENPEQWRGWLLL